MTVTVVRNITDNDDYQERAKSDKIDSVSLSLLPTVKHVSLDFQNIEPNSWVLVV